MIVIIAVCHNIKTHGLPQNHAEIESNKNLYKRNALVLISPSRPQQIRLRPHDINHLDCLSDSAVIPPLSE